MLARTPKPTTAEVIELIVDHLPPFPRFPEAMGGTILFLDRPWLKFDFGRVDREDYFAAGKGGIK